MTGRMVRLGIAASSLFLLVALGQPAVAESPEAFLKTVNADSDKTLSLPEVQAYALKRFNALDTDHDGTLSQEELGDRISAKDLEEADTKHKAPKPMLSKAAFSIYVSKLFAAANTHMEAGETSVDGKLSVEELGGPDGAKLIKLLE